MTEVLLPEVKSLFHEGRCTENCNSTKSALVKSNSALALL